MVDTVSILSADRDLIRGLMDMDAAPAAAAPAPPPDGGGDDEMVNRITTWDGVMMLLGVFGLLVEYGSGARGKAPAAVHQVSSANTANQLLHPTTPPRTHSSPYCPPPTTNRHLVIPASSHPALLVAPRTRVPSALLRPDGSHPRSPHLPLPS